MPTDAASCSTCAEEPKKRSLSRSHCTTAPPTKTLPSSAYAGGPPAVAAMVVMSLSRDKRNSLPMCRSRKHPVP